MRFHFQDESLQRRTGLPPPSQRPSSSKPASKRSSGTPQTSCPSSRPSSCRPSSCRTSSSLPASSRPSSRPSSCRPSSKSSRFFLFNKQDHLRMNVAPDRTIILGLQIVLDHRSLSSIGQKIWLILPHSPSPQVSSQQLPL